MKIITIGRQFGSGGRELGKRLSDALGFDYYDREIITSIAEKYGMNDAYVEKAFGARDRERFVYSLILGKANTRNYVHRL